MTVTANSIITPQKAVTFTAVATAAETAFQAPTNAVALVDESVAGANDNGLRITSLGAITRAAVATACNCQLYRKQGSVYTLVASVAMGTGTPSASVANQAVDFGYSDDNPLILAPGVGHGWGDTGPAPQRYTDALLRWVEEGKAPAMLHAELRDESGTVIRSRPLFPYPCTAKYQGHGSTDDAASFVSSLPEPLPETT